MRQVVIKRQAADQTMVVEFTPQRIGRIIRLWWHSLERGVYLHRASMFNPPWNYY